MARLWTLIALCLVFAVPASAQAQKVHWHKQGASVFTDSTGTHDNNLWAKNSVAELNMGTAMGNLPFGAKLRLHYAKTGRTVTAYLLDIGAGGGDVFGHTRAVDIHCKTARALRINDCENWTGLILWRRVG
jgi:hypothetical protein